MDRASPNVVSVNVNNTCNWSPGTSYYHLIAKYIQVLRSPSSDSNVRVNLKSWPTYNWEEVLIVVTIALLMMRARLWLNHTFNVKVQHYFPSVNSETVLRSSMYLVRFVESLFLAVVLFFMLVYGKPCPAIWDFDVLRDPEPLFALKGMQLWVMGRTIAHFYDLLFQHQQEKRSDTHILFVHHCTVFALAIISRIQLTHSIWILFVHELSEPPFSLGKAALYLVMALSRSPGEHSTTIRKLELLRECQLLLFVSTWFYCRMYLFPCRLIFSAFEYYNLGYNHVIITAGISLLLVLFLMHTFWSCFILKLIVLRLVRGKFVDTTIKNNRNAQKDE